MNNEEKKVGTDDSTASTTSIKNINEELAPCTSEAEGASSSSSSSEEEVQLRTRPRRRPFWFAVASVAGAGAAVAAMSFSNLSDSRVLGGSDSSVSAHRDGVDEKKKKEGKKKQKKPTINSTRPDDRVNIDIRRMRGGVVAFDASVTVPCVAADDVWSTVRRASLGEEGRRILEEHSDQLPIFPTLSHPLPP